jgi:protein-disulfide isomerase
VRTLPLKLKTLLSTAFLVALGASALTARSRPVERVTYDEIVAARAMGVRNAPIMLEDFADYECPACKFLFENTTGMVIRNYVDTGKVYLVHHDFPIHQHSVEAMKWANAAAIIGKFEPVEAALYAQQAVWDASGNIEPIVAGVLTPAELKRCEALLNDPEIAQAIQQDHDLGLQRRVNQTPSLFVTHNGRVVPLPPGPVQYPILKQYLDYLLKQ